MSLVAKVEEFITEECPGYKGADKMFFNDVQVKNIIEGQDPQRGEYIRIEFPRGNVIRLYRAKVSIRVKEAYIYFYCDMRSSDYTIESLRDEHDCEESDMSIEELIGV